MTFPQNIVSYQCYTKVLNNPTQRTLARQISCSARVKTHGSTFLSECPADKFPVTPGKTFDFHKRLLSNYKQYPQIWYTNIRLSPKSSSFQLHNHKINLLFLTSTSIFCFMHKRISKFRKKVYVDLLGVGDSFSSKGTADIYDFIRIYAPRTR